MGDKVVKLMKRIYFFFISLALFVYYPNLSFAYTDKECSELSGKAKTEFAARLIMYNCGNSDSFFSKNKELKCAIKAGDATTEFAARRIFSECTF